MILTTTEYKTRLTIFLKRFATVFEADMISKIWLAKKPSTSNKEKNLMWLFFYALNDFEHFDESENYLTEEQVINIFAKANTI